MTFTIDNENHITAHGTPEEAAAATATPSDSFASQEELVELAAAWPAERLLAIWNSLPGVRSAKQFKDSTTAIQRIWKRIQGLGVSRTSKAGPRARRTAKRGARVAKGALAKAKASKRATPNQHAPQSQNAAQEQAPAAPGGPPFCYDLRRGRAGREQSLLLRLPL